MVLFKKNGLDGWQDYVNERKGINLSVKTDYLDLSLDMIRSRELREKLCIKTVSKLLPQHTKHQIATSEWLNKQNEKVENNQQLQYYAN